MLSSGFNTNNHFLPTLVLCAYSISGGFVFKISAPLDVKVHLLFLHHIRAELQLRSYWSTSQTGNTSGRHGGGLDRQRPESRQLNPVAETPAELVRWIYAEDCSVSGCSSTSLLVRLQSVTSNDTCCCCPTHTNTSAPHQPGLPW